MSLLPPLNKIDKVPFLDILVMEPNQSPSHQTSGSKKFRLEFQEIWVNMAQRELEIYEMQQLFRHHPKTIDCISPMMLDRIFHHLNAESLRNCRLVCRRWTIKAKNELQRKTIIILDSYGKLNRFVSEFKTSPLFHTNFCINGISTSVQPTMLFFSIFGRFIKELEIRKCLLMGQCIPILLRAVPYLQSLTLIGRISSGDAVYPNVHKLNPETIEVISRRLNWALIEEISLDLGGYSEELQDWTFRSDAGKIQPFVFQLLMATPNLTNLNFQSHESYFPRMILNTILFKSELKLKKLQKISLGSVPNISNFELKHLEIKKLPLVHLDLEVLPEISLNILHNLLASLGPTLKVMKLKFRRVDSDGVITQFFPSSPFLKNLKELTLVDYKGSMAFVLDLASLQVMYLQSASVEVFVGPGGERIPLPVELRFGPFLNLEEYNASDRSMYVWKNYK